MDKKIYVRPETQVVVLQPRVHLLQISEEVSADGVSAYRNGDPYSNQENLYWW